jgi:hypothetical protein
MENLFASTLAEQKAVGREAYKLFKRRNIDKAQSCRKKESMP